jgi:O-antigen/teichoic acid export membrane protein
MSMLQVVVSGAVLLVLYSFVVRALGVAAFGVWSLVLATVSAGRLGDLGMARAVVRFVAQRLGRDDEAEAALIVETAAVTLGGVGALLLPILYLPCAWSLRAVVSGPSQPDALRLLPYALASVWLLAIGGVFQSALDGCQRIDVRNLIGIGANILHLALTLVLVPRYGLDGLAYAQILQCSALVVGSWIALRRQLPPLSIVPRTWRRLLAGEMLRYSVNLQVASAAQLLFEPVTKVLMTKFGGLEAVGYFEMANRLLLQVRRLPLSAAEVLVPVVAHLETKPGNRVGSICREAFGLLTYCSVPLFGIVVALAPVVSAIWLGRREPVFIVFVSVLAAAWFVNTLASVAYFANLGSGRLLWNTATHLVMGVVNIALGLGLGRMFGAGGVLLAFACAILCGSAILALSYYREQKASLITFCTRLEGTLVAVAMCGIAAAWLACVTLRSGTSDWVTGAVAAVVFCATVAIPAWQHPVRHQLTAHIGQWVGGVKRVNA